jgi:antitoxin HicB
MRVYTIVLEYDAQVHAYSVSVPLLRGCYTQGDTVEEAIANAREAISGHIAALEQIGAPVPEEQDDVPADAVRAMVRAPGKVLLGRVAA